ncbi:MAG: RDD family protein [Armatimonadetes bacterium]|nr:RDD family protein [Armatimonadota bacterium]
MQSDQVTLETPERVELEFELAGIGSRFLAAVIDSLLQFLILVALALALGASRWVFTGNLDSIGLSALLVFMSSMLVVVIYYVAFEMAWAGQSPGKRLAGLVVVTDQGGPLSFTQSLVRNILRLVDILPILYMTGFFSILVTRQCKRLGDMAAGTLVIKVRTFEPAGDESADEPAPDAPRYSHPVGLVARAMPGVASLSPRERETVVRFTQRRFELDEASRRDVAERIAEGLRQKFPALSIQEVPDAEVFIQIVYDAWMASQRAAGPPQ